MKLLFGVRGGADRNSSIELLKVFAVIIIVISHSTPEVVAYYDISLPAYINVAEASSNVQHVILSMVKYFGLLGNCIFVAASAYFLADSEKVKLNKVGNIIIDALFFAWLWFAVIKSLGFTLNSGQLLSTCLPVTKGNNWFVGCYLILYMIHPGLNCIIEKSSKRQLLCMNVLGIIFFSVMQFVLGGYYYYYNELTGFIMIYFITAYMKKYLVNYSLNTRLNQITLVCSLLAMIVLLILSNVLGLYYDFARYWVFRWLGFNNPFIIMITLSLFNIFKNIKFKNRFINHISSLSLVIYIIHEDALCRFFLKPMFWIYIYQKYTYDYVVVWVLVFSAGCFLISCLAGFLYKYTVKIFLSKLIGRICCKAERMFNHCIDYLIKLE